MSHYLSLDPENLALDRGLMELLPAGLAAYYLALPLGCEDGAVSVAMAYPENRTALAVLTDAMDAPVVPVRASAAAIRHVIRRQEVTAPLPALRVLAWCDEEEYAGLVTATARRFGRAFSALVTTLSSRELDLEDVLDVAREGQYSLTVIHLPPDVAPSLLLPRAPTPLLLLRNRQEHPKRVLIVLRGYSADEQLLNWLTPLLSRNTAVTLMPVAAEGANRLQLLMDRAANGHLQACLEHPTLRHSQAFVRFREGSGVRQIEEETKQGNYDLVVIAAEGYGHFVSQILTAIEQQAIGQHSFFILKPPASIQPQRLPIGEDRSSV